MWVIGRSNGTFIFKFAVGISIASLRIIRSPAVAETFYGPVPLTYSWMLSNA